MILATVANHHGLMVGHLTYNGKTYYAYGTNDKDFCYCAQRRIRENTGDTVSVGIGYKYEGDVDFLAMKCNIKHTKRLKFYFDRLGDKSAEIQDLENQKVEYVDEVVGNVLRVYKLVPVKVYEVKGDR